MHKEFLKFLEPFQQQLENSIRSYFKHFKGPTRLIEACQYSLMNGGKRFRPFLTYLIAKELNPAIDVSLAGLAIEFFHTASLIADDLPCMDNEHLRRNQPSLHVAFGEDIALLASYALISEGYTCIVKNKDHLKDFLPHIDQICLLAIENACYNTGLQGATSGQYIDIYPETIDLHKIEELICKKTVSLFEISFVFGWLFGGGDLDKLSEVKNAAYHFGMAFQIFDDIDDMATDLEANRKANFALAYGKEVALLRYDQEMVLFRQTLQNLGLEKSPIASLMNLLKNFSSTHS